MTEGDEADEGKRDDVRDEALTFLNTLDSMMTKLLNNKISNSTEGEEERKCEKEKLEEIISTGEEGDEGKRDDIRDEALTYLNTLDSMMTKLLNNKISNSTEGDEGKRDDIRDEALTYLNT